MDDDLRARLAATLTPLSALVHEGIATAIVVVDRAGVEQVRFGDPTEHIPGPAFSPDLIAREKEYSVIVDETDAVHAYVCNFSGTLLAVLFEDEADLESVRSATRVAAEAIAPLLR